MDVKAFSRHGAAACLLILLAVCFCACGSKTAEAKTMTIQEFLENQGGDEEATMTVTIVSVLNPVWALVEDESGATVNLFGITIDGEFMNFDDAQVYAGDTITITNCHYNVYDDTVEIADAILVSRE